MTLELGPSENQARLDLVRWQQIPPNARFGNHLLLGARGAGKSTVLHSLVETGARLIRGVDFLQYLLDQNSSAWAFSPGELAQLAVTYARNQVGERQWCVCVDLWPALQPYFCIGQPASAVHHFAKTLEREQTGYRLIVWEIPSDAPGLPDSQTLKSMFDARVSVDGRERALVLPFREADCLTLYSRGLAALPTVRSYYEARRSGTSSNEGGA